jgi:uncharacterized protein
MSISPESALILLLILTITGTIVFVADAVIFIRWITYLWAKYRAEEEQARLLTNRQQPVAAETGEPAEGAVVPEEPWDSAAYPPYPNEPTYPFARTWSLVDPFLAFQVVFIGGQIAIAVVLIPVLFWHGKFQGEGAVFSPAGIIIQCLGLFFMNACFVAATAFYVRRYGSSLAQIGLRRPTSRQIAMGCGLGIALFIGSTAIETALGSVLPHILPKPVLDGLIQFTKDVTAGGLFGSIPSLQLKIFFALAGAIAAPIGEEVFFRGLLYNSLKRRINVPAAIVISGLAFALVHIGPLAIVVIFPMGMLLAYVYEKTRSLWVTICIHATNNGLAFVIALTFPHFGEPPAPPVNPAPRAGNPAISAPAPAHSRSAAHAPGGRPHE